MGINDFIEGNGVWTPLKQCLTQMMYESMRAEEPTVSLDDIKLLLDCGADVNQKTLSYGMCYQSLECAIICGMSVEVIKLLVERGAETNLTYDIPLFSETGDKVYY